MSARLRKIVFTSLTLLIPFVVLGGTELVLRLLNVGASNRKPFITISGKPDHLAVNPEFAGKYFSGFVPAVAFNPFQKSKSEDVFRVVTLGGSTTAGFPYHFYYGFPQGIERHLVAAMPDRKVEVVNLGMTAVNSYTLWDLRSEIAQINPDVIVIYAGHNEYYGAFGAGSTVYSLGNHIWLKHLFLRIQRTAIFSALRGAIGAFSSTPDDANGKTDRTLMAQVVKDASIEWDDDTFMAGEDQFKKNMEDVIDTFSSAGIPVFIGTLVSNLSDQAPLGTNVIADSIFVQAQAQCCDKLEETRDLFIRAKDLDNIRFRAPSSFNKIVADLSQVSGVTLVDLQQIFNDASSSGIPGRDLFIDHLHPTADGYELMADTFAGAIVAAESNVKAASKDRTNSPVSQWPVTMPLDPLEESHSRLLIQRLLADYPFYRDRTPDQISRISDALVRRFRTSGYLTDSLASRMVSSPLSAADALVQALEQEKLNADSSAVLKLYRSLLYWQPFNTRLTQEAVSYGIRQPAYDDLTLLLAIEGARRVNDIFFWNAVGAILMRTERLEGAGNALRRAESIDPTSRIMLYNRARLELAVGDTIAARTYFERYQNATPQQ